MNVLARYGSRITIALLLLALVSGCGKPDAVPPVVVDVQAVSVMQQPITEQIQADAVLAPLAQAAVATRITAPVHKFYVQRGSHVKAGELLATLENRDLNAAALDSQGSYDAASAGYRTAANGQIPEDFQRAQLDLTQAQANLNLNQQVVNSRQDLFNQGALPGRDLDAAKAALVQAQAAFATAHKHLTALKAGGREDALQSAKGQLTSAKGKYLGAEAQLSYSQIRSPIRGVVTDRPLFVGETAAAGTPLLTVMDTTSLIAKTHLSQAVVQPMNLGASAEVYIRGIDKPVQGKVTLISPALDPGSTTVEVWVQIENAQDKLRAGTPVHLVMNGRTVPNAIVVPTNAVLADASGKKTIMTIGADQIAHLVAIQTGITADGLIQIIAGVHSGERIVSSGSYGLDDGTRVQVVAALPASNAGSGDKN